MGRTFTRVTFAGPSGRADVSVPDDLPVALLVDQVRDLLRAPSGVRWVITHPAAGDLAADATLRDAGVLDGELLYLRQDGDGYEPPYVEDVAEEAGATDAAPAWSPDDTRRVLTTAALVWLGLTGPALLWRFGAGVATVPLALTVVVLFAGAVAGMLARRRAVTSAFSWALVPAAASLAGSIAAAAGMPATFTTAAVAGAASIAVGLAAPLLAGQQDQFAWSALLGTAATAVALLVWASLVAGGLGSDRAAGAVGVVLLAIHSFLPQIATQLTGLGRLADSVAEGDPVRRERVRRAAREARAILSGLLAGFGVPVVVMVAVLSVGGGGWQRGLAALLTAAMLLHARRYSRPAHVLPPCLGGLAGLAALSAGFLWAPDGPGAAAATVAALTGGAVLAAASLAKVTPPTRSRIRLAYERAETIVLLGCGVALFGVFNAFAWAFEIVR